LAFLLLFSSSFFSSFLISTSLFPCSKLSLFPNLNFILIPLLIFLFYVFYFSPLA
jgi:hypothetical protein